MKAKDIKELRELTGCGMIEAKQALEIFSDQYLAAGWLHAKAIALNVRGDRKQWNLDNAERFSERFKKNETEQ